MRASNAPISIQEQQQQQQQQQSVDNGIAEGTSRTNSAERTTTAGDAGKSHYYDSSAGVSSQPGNPSCTQGKTASSEAMSTRGKVEGASGDESHIKAGEHHLSPWMRDTFCEAVKSHPTHDTRFKTIASR